MDLNREKVRGATVHKAGSKYQHDRLYSGRTKYSAFVSKLNKLSEEYLSPQKTQKAAVFFYSKDLGRENDLKS